MKSNFIIGIDEAGRGPLAGPVSVGVFCFQKGTKIGELKKILDISQIRDSKKLSEFKREAVFERIKKISKKYNFLWHVSLISNKTVDKRGITQSVQIGIDKCLKKIDANPLSDQIYLDGGINAPKLFIKQKTLIKGDEKVPVIALASICAKVVRDRKMKQLGKRYPEYGFGVHKGYGTREHVKKIKKYGLTPIHRKTFIKNLQKSKNKLYSSSQW